MTDIESRRHGLESFLSSVQEGTGAAAGMTVRIVPDRGQVNLRGDVRDVEFGSAVSRVLGQALPAAENSMTNGEHRVYWLGPDEWLIECKAREAGGIVAGLRESVVARRSSVTDVSGGYVVLRLGGPHARTVLAKGCTLDLHEDAFPVGACAQSGLAKASVLIGRSDEQPEFEIVVRRTFAEYVVLWLRHSAREFGVNIEVT